MTDQIDEKMTSEDVTPEPRPAKWEIKLFNLVNNVPFAAGHNGFL